MEYKKILKKIYLVESLGEALYSCMAKKKISSELSSIYNTLGKNEANMKHLIEKEASKHSISLPRYQVKLYVMLSSMFFKLSPHFMLERMLVLILRKQMFSSYHNVYHQTNVCLWNQLLMHEKLQYQLLNL